MKHILISIIFFVKIAILGTQVCFAQTDVSAQSGMLFNNKYLQATVYGEFESIADGEKSAKLNSWALMARPFDFLLLAGGTLTYGGTWSLFNTPSPRSINALKQPYARISDLITNLPGSETKTAPLTVVMGISFPFLKIDTFLGGFQENQFFGGVGLSLPFSVKAHKQLLSAGLRGALTLAWQVVPLEQKEHDTWFIPHPPFILDYYHSFIQEFTYKTKFTSLFVATGFSQNPYTTPSGFVRTEYSLALPIFALNGQFFMCDIDYLGQDGNFERDTIRMAINPQLRFSFFGTAIRSIHFGITTEVAYQNTIDLIPISDWYTNFKLAADVQFVMLSLGASANISDLLLVQNENTPYLLFQSESLLKIQSKLLFRPWYAKSFVRTWALNGAYEKYFQKPDSIPKFNLKSNFSGSFTIAKLHQFGIHIGTELEFELVPKITLESLHFLFKATTDLYANFLKSTQSLQLDAQAEFDIKESNLEGLKVDFSIVLKL